MTDMTLRPSATDPGRTYRWYNDSVLPFGYGLHYTSFSARFATANTSSYHSQSHDTLGKSHAAPNTAFAISDIMTSCTAAYPDLCNFATFPITVTNTGETTSDFVALAFLRGEYGPTPYPIKTLAAYTRIKSIETDQIRAATLLMTLGNLARTDINGNTVLYPGSYTVLLDVPAQDEVSVTLTGSELVLDEWPQPRPNNGSAIYLQASQLAEMEALDYADQRADG